MESLVPESLEEEMLTQGLNKKAEPLLGIS